MIERLHKYMAACGVASRRKCEHIISEGRVKVNGVVVNKLGTTIDDERDEILVDNKIIKKENKKVYILLNKPRGYISSVKDDRGRKTLLDIVKVNERVYPIGRLDYNTSGAIILTNDGEVYNNIAHPGSNKSKIYIAAIKGIPSSEEIKRFENGIDIGGYITAKAKFDFISSNKESSKVKIEIHEGKNRQVRKMCDAIGHPVITLMRIAIGDIKLGNLKEGAWRYLTEKEIQYIKGGKLL
ncbi:pseudouridine synthase [Clostridium kluyveri]|uniref:Pseudouridine synthase n=2 Tax=Clostridium kluyveri TaxID=1534 RepID=A5N8H3_CLOK5|nr:pseudouridine synthase [Clostridium kluyveri]EDK33604.1 RNA pseudouridine synthase-related protein [Clostridium kluyveri DSM 555]